MGASLALGLLDCLISSLAMVAVMIGHNFAQLFFFLVIGVSISITVAFYACMFEAAAIVQNDKIFLTLESI